MEKFTRLKWWLCGISFILLSMNSMAQNETNHWYFGVYAGLDFSSGSPVADGNGQVYTNEGCSSMSDPAGNLLFYTDGITVWNKNHEVMPNGTDLQGGSSSTQAALIVPDPANPNRYYLFTTDEIGGPNGFQFSLVDMSLQGGLGDVTTKDSVIQENVTEKLAAVRQGHKGDYWIAVHHWGTNEYDVYSLTINGLSATPVVSTIGTQLTTDSIQFTYGQLKFSPCGDKLASANTYLDTVDVFDFDIETGIISNRIGLRMPANVYGVEFSPNEQFLYVTTYDLENGLLQYDLSAGSVEDIIDSKQVINFSEDLYAMQLGLDGKIYVCKSWYSHLGAINSPDLAGLDCDFDLNAVDLDPNFEGTTSALGLPDFVASFLASPDCIALGVDETNSHSEVSVFPNPSPDHFTLHLAQENASVEIYNSQGALMEKFSSAGKKDFQFGQDYPSGIYLVVIKNDKENKSIKVVKTD